jgi:glycosyltransferase involved in cell wall biosynthesis
MRVLLDCRMADWSGVGRYTTGLARALARRADVDLVQAVRAGAAPPVGDAEVHVARRGVLSPLGSMELGRIARTARPDVTHCPHYPTPFPTPHPLVVTIHDLAPLLVEGVMPSALKRGVYKHWNGEAIAYADALLTDAAFTVGEVERVFPKAKGRMSVVPLGVDDFAAGPVGDLPSAAAGAPYVLSMGNTKAHKDLPTLLRAFATVVPPHPELRLILAGLDRPGYAREVLGDDPAADRVAFTGPLDDGALRALYAGAAVFAFPSRFEGFGLPPLEAMALGAPVVCTTAASLPEVVGDAALLFDPGDAATLAGLLSRVLDDADLAADLRARGLVRARRLTWDATAERTIEVYREALARMGVNA